RRRPWWRRGSWGPRPRGAPTRRDRRGLPPPARRARPKEETPMHIVRAGEGRIIDGQGSTLKVLLEPGASPVRSALMGIVEVGAGVRLPAEADRFSSHDCEELLYVHSGSVRGGGEGSV